MKRKILLSCVVLIGLAACGPEIDDDDDDGLSALTKPHGEDPPEIRETDDDKVVLVIGGVETAPLSRKGVLDVDGFSAYMDEATQRIAFIGASASGDVFAYVAGSRAITGVSASGGYFGRSSGSELPDSGSAVFNGDYVGLFQILTPNVYYAQSFIDGDVELTANFDSMEIAGSITNRRLLLMSDGTEVDDAPSGSVSNSSYAGDVELHAAEISANGTFNGTTTGDNYVYSVGGPTLAGTWNGMIGGEDGTEVVGTLTQLTDGGHTVWIEQGVFIATSPSGDD